ncbi:hypothetical protein ACEOTL_005535, partial [Klebsiella pneumoniae]
QKAASSLTLQQCRRQEREHLQPLPSRVRRDEAPLLDNSLRPVPLESLQHPLSVYDAIGEACR